MSRKKNFSVAQKIFLITFALTLAFAAGGVVGLCAAMLRKHTNLHYLAIPIILGTIFAVGYAARNTMQWILRTRMMQPPDKPSRK